MHSTASKLGLPTGVTAVEQGQAIGRAEQRVRALSERLHISVEDARRRGVEIILNHIVAQWAVRHAEWIQNLLVQSDVDLRDGGRVNIYSRRSRHWEQRPEQCCWFLGASACSKQNQRMTDDPDS